MKSPVLILAVILPVLFAACENQNSGTVTARLKFAATQENSADLTSKASAGEGLLIDSATINLRNINLLVQNSNGQITNSANNVFAGPYLINLITHTSNPVIAPANIAAGTYYGINGLLNVPQNTKISIYISGTYTMNDKWWKFYYTNSSSLTFQVVDSAGFIVDQAKPEIWVVIDVVSFFKGIDFSKAVIDKDNVIRISESSNPSLATAIQNNFIVAASVSNNPPSGKDNNSQGSNQSAGGNSGGSSGNNSGSVSNPSNAGSGNSGTVSNSGNDNHNQDKDKNKEKEKNKSKEKHDQKNNNKTKDKNKDKDKDKDKEGG